MINKMKITVTENTKREIELTFPCSFKDNLGFHIHCYNESGAIKVYNSSFNMFSTEAVIVDYRPELECTKEEVMAAFDDVVRRSRAKAFPIEYNPDINLTDGMTEKELINELHRQGGLHGN